MRYTVIIIALAALTACNKGPEVDERNASVEEVAQKVRESGGDALFQPGQWQTKVTVKDMTIPGMPEAMQGRMKQMLAQRQNVVAETCLTPDEAKKPGGKFFTGKESKDCRYDHFTMSGGKVDAVMRCKGSGGSSGAMVMTLNGTYTPTESTTNVDMQISGPDGTMKMTAVTENKRIGDCKGEETKVAAGGGQ